MINERRRIMRRSVKTAAVAIVMGMALAAPVYAMTGGELKIGRAHV